ncbi:MAG: hypothetical protein ACOVOO_09720 [Flavobacteriales bacterium]|jgi:hypothetical protein
MKKITPLILSLFTCFSAVCAFAQPVPAADENIPFLVTFSKDAGTKWGDDDFSQVFFFSVPKDYKSPIYIRVYDPECGGKNDEANNGFNSMTKYSLYGGQGCITTDDARNIDPVGNYKSGNLLGTKAFGVDPKFDDQWFTFGPFNPSEGELAPKYGGYIFKLICEGIKGDDGNLYRYFMSTKGDKNIPIEGGNAFTFEYCFRLHADPNQTSHVYPYVDEKVISLNQSNFDWDNEGYIKLVSVVTAGEFLKTSEEDKWATSNYTIKDAERKKSLDIQFKKDSKRAINNNNVVFYVRNQYGEMLPFFTIPIGGIPKPTGEISIKRASPPKK